MAEARGNEKEVRAEAAALIREGAAAQKALAAAEARAEKAVRATGGGAGRRGRAGARAPLCSSRRASGCGALVTRTDPPAYNILLKHI